jgi:hypothetical protein
LIQDSIEEKWLGDGILRSVDGGQLFLDVIPLSWRHHDLYSLIAILLCPITYSILKIPIISPVALNTDRINK